MYMRCCLAAPAPRRHAQPRAALATGSPATAVTVALTLENGQPKWPHCNRTIHLLGRPLPMHQNDPRFNCTIHLLGISLTSRPYKCSVRRTSGCYNIGGQGNLASKVTDPSGFLSPLPPLPMFPTQNLTRRHVHLRSNCANQTIDAFPRQSSPTRCATRPEPDPSPPSSTTSIPKDWIQSPPSPRRNHDYALFVFFVAGRRGLSVPVLVDYPPLRSSPGRDCRRRQVALLSGDSKSK